MSGDFVDSTVEQARRELGARLRQAGIEAAEIEARMLLGAVVGLDLTGLIAQGARALSAPEAALLADYARRRMGGEPASRIVGTREFWGLSLALSPATLVPRPDTETVVELALEILADRALSEEIRIADLGTGSGAILLALLHERPGAFGVGTDIALEALTTARRNAAALNLSSRAAFVRCDYAAAIGFGFDLVVSNPPYIAAAGIAALDAEVRAHDPHLALDGGVDGLDAYRALIPQAAMVLRPGGALVVESGQGQTEKIATLMRASGLTVAIPPKHDLAGIPRAVSARKLPP